MADKKTVLTYTRTYLPHNKKSVQTFISDYPYNTAIILLAEKIEHWNLMQPLYWKYELGVNNEYLSQSSY